MDEVTLELFEKKGYDILLKIIFDKSYKEHSFVFYGYTKTNKNKFFELLHKNYYIKATENSFFIQYELDYEKLSELYIKQYIKHIDKINTSFIKNNEILVEKYDSFKHHDFFEYQLQEDNKFIRAVLNNVQKYKSKPKKNFIQRLFKCLTLTK